MYRDMTKINENFKKLGIDVDKIQGGKLQWKLLQEELLKKTTKY